MKMLIAVGGALVLCLAFALPAPAQTAATGRLMREKLTHAQRILEALTTSNYDLLASEASRLSEVTTAPAWTVLKMPEYRRQSDEFLRITEDLVAAAKNRDLDLAATRFSALTMSCYQCHRYIKNMRLAR
jgi:cytochrome c556